MTQSLTLDICRGVDDQTFMIGPGPFLSGRDCLGALDLGKAFLHRLASSVSVVAEEVAEVSSNLAAVLVELEPDIGRFKKTAWAHDVFLRHHLLLKVLINFNRF